MVDGKSFRLADEVRYIQRRAAEHDSRIVSIGQVVLFSSESGDAWMLDPSEHLAVRLASDGHAGPVHSGGGAHCGKRKSSLGARTRARVREVDGGSRISALTRGGSSRPAAVRNCSRRFIRSERRGS